MLLAHQCEDNPVCRITPDWTAEIPSDENAMALSVLVVTKDHDLRERIIAYLSERRCRAVGVSDMPPTARLQADRFSLLVLDVYLEPVDGFAVLRRVRTESDIPVIMITRKRRDDFDCVIGLELGADDVLGQPVNPRELLARGRAILRRHGMVHQFHAQPQSGGYRFIGWELRRRSRTVTDPAGSVVNLSKNEYALLNAFLEAPRRILSRLHLMRATRPHEDIFDRSIDVQVLRLRRKLRPSPSEPELIKTERGVGYLFDAPVEPFF